MAWQEHHIAWLKLYHQTLWKVCKTINYLGINSGMSHVKHDKMGDLIKKLIIFPFWEFSNEYGTIFFPPLSVSVSLFFSFLLSFLCTNWHTRTQTHTLSFSGHSCATSVIQSVCVRVCMNCCIHWHNYIFKSQLIFTVSFTFFLSFFFSKHRNWEINFRSPLVQLQIHERELLSLVSEDMREMNTSVAGVTPFFFHPFACPHSYSCRPSPHLLWSKTASA